MKTKNPLLLIDGYKADHRRQYPEGTEFVYSNFTPRKSRIEGVEHVVFFGLQYFIKEYLQNQFNEGFFNRPKVDVISEYKRRMESYLGPNALTYEHVEDLHDLGYLPIEIRALPEGSLVPIGVPVFTVINTKPEFFWITNYLETLFSAVVWKPITSATTAYQYLKEFKRHAEKTGVPKAFIGWQGHDFSFRGMSGLEDAVLSGAGHLLSFTGSDTIPSIEFMETYYKADCEKELIAGSVPATEHSVMCMGTKDNEIETFRRLIEDVYPSGIVSIVSDTWDFWKVITEFLPNLKDKITSRNGRVVIRPDSGDPVKIICGDEQAQTEWERKGAYEVLYDIFGGQLVDGYKHLHESIGLIYGDSITLSRQKEILSKLEKKGFSASNLVLGIGSFTYEYTTRDTYGFAMKATWGQVNGEGRPIFKDPKTDDGTKKSAKGLLSVQKDDKGEYKLIDNCVGGESTEMKLIFLEGDLIVDQSLAEIRSRLQNY